MITKPWPAAGAMLSRVHLWLRQRPHGQWQLLAHLLAISLLVKLLLGVPAAADAIAMLLKGSGLLALQLLLASLSISPLIRLLRCSPLLAARRPLGLWAFACACLHLLIWLGLEQQWAWPQLALELLSRSHLQLGFIAWLLLLPLAITSTRPWQQRLGRRWQQLHRLVYVITLLAGGHYLIAAKSLHLQLLIYLLLALLLLAWRLPSWWRR